MTQIVPAAAVPSPAATSAGATPPAVLFAAGRAETATHVRIEAFDGPLGLLLALIEARQLDILTVPLGALAEAYLEALATLDGDRLGNVSSFIAVASQLILIKSRAILPRPPKPQAVSLDDEPDPEAELRARLLEYRRYRDAGQLLGERLGTGHAIWRRDAEVAASSGRAGARPPERPPMPASTLANALRRLVAIVPVEPETREVVARSVTLAERAAIIREALKRADQIVLQDLLGTVHDRVVVAVTFLALLELSKRREVTLEQTEPWGPIVARKLVPAEAAADGGRDDRRDGEGGDIADEPAGDAEFDESLGSFA